MPSSTYVFLFKYEIDGPVGGIMGNLWKQDRWLQFQ